MNDRARICSDNVHCVPIFSRWQRLVIARDKLKRREGTKETKGDWNRRQGGKRRSENTIDIFITILVLSSLHGEALFCLCLPDKLIHCRAIKFVVIAEWRSVRFEAEAQSPGSFETSYLSFSRIIVERVKILGKARSMQLHLLRPILSSNETFFYMFYVKVVLSPRFLFE